MLNPYFWAGMDNLRSIGVMVECPDDEEANSDDGACIFMGCMPFPAPGEKRARNPAPPETVSLPPRFKRVMARMIVDVPPMIFPQFRIILAKLPNTRDVGRAMKKLLRLRPDFELSIDILSNSYEDVDMLARAWTSKVMRFAEGVAGPLHSEDGEENEMAAKVGNKWETDSSDLSGGDSDEDSAGSKVVESDNDEDTAVQVKAEPRSPPRVKTEHKSPPRVKTEPHSPPRAVRATTGGAEYQESARVKQEPRSPTPVKDEHLSPTPR